MPGCQFVLDKPGQILPRQILSVPPFSMRPGDNLLHVPAAPMP